MKDNKYKSILYVILSFIIVCSALLFLSLNKSYDVNYITKGGTIYPSVKVHKNELVTKPNNPVLEGYTFIGWYDGDTDEEFDFTKPITKNTNIVAKYKSIM